IEDKYRTAAESVLRRWLDAVVVRDQASVLDMLQKLKGRKNGNGAALISIESVDNAGSNGNETLGAHIRCPTAVEPLVRRITANVVVVEEPGDMSLPVPAGTTYVTFDGMVLRSDGTAEMWTQPPSETPEELREEVSGMDSRISNTESAIKSLAERQTPLAEALAEAVSSLDEKKHALAVQEGESRHVAHEADRVSERLETVTWELESIAAEQEKESDRALSGSIEENRARHRKISADIESAVSELNEMEDRRESMQTELTDRRVKFTELRHELESLENRRESSRNHLEQLETLVANRSEGIESYKSNIESLQKEITEAESRIQPLEQNVRHENERAEQLRVARRERAARLAEKEQQLAAKRDELETIRSGKSEIALKQNEQQIKRQNIIDRVGSDYSIGEVQIEQEPEPEWENGKPDMESLETSIAELRTKLEAMGPVNLVAIDEHEELQERYSFLTQEQDDLVKSKDQLLNMIRKINRTTSEMFESTFAQVNSNFSDMFKKLFDGGSAKLVLVDEEDILESGIEIIARPPGKRLQNISLLSGGERTLTAVALLFAIYMIKPSPFCLLDELDAALDESNIGRFVKVLEGFLDQSQFVVITHNRKTIAAAHVIYGVTMSEEGISDIVSMKFSEGEKEPVAAK
ncbi:MAG: hypothetical protein R6V03_05210, partial [Kiritimatiellia bacterium]